MKLFKLSTLLPIAGAIAAGALLFWTSQNVQQSENALRSLQKSVKSEEQTIRVLHAEWDYLNRPDRLEELAARHLGVSLSSSAAFSVSDDLSALPDLLIPVLPRRKPQMEAQPIMLRSSSFNALLEEMNKEGGKHE